MKLRYVVLPGVIALTQIAHAGNGQFYIDDSETQSDQAEHEASCESLVPGVESSVQQKANVQCGSTALRRSEWSIECFRPTMNHNPQDYIFARVGASFECSQSD